MRVLTLGVWAVCMMATAAHGDVIKADLQWAWDDPPPLHVSAGKFRVSYDPTTVMADPDPTYPGFGRPGTVLFDFEGNNNFSIMAADVTPEGWIDVQAQFWDLTVDGVAGTISDGRLGGSVWNYEEFFLEDGIRLVNTPEESYIQWTLESWNADTETFGEPLVVVRDNVDWQDITIEVPEPATIALILGALACMAIWRSW